MIPEELEAPARLVAVSYEDLQDRSLHNHIKEVYDARDMLSQLQDERPKLLVNFCYSSSQDILLIVMCAQEDESVRVNKLAFKDGSDVKGKHIDALYESYRYQILLANKRQENPDAGMIKAFEDTCLSLVHLFISPIVWALRSNTHLLISMNINIFDRLIFVDLSHLFDLRYRFYNIPQKEDVLVTMISLWMPTFIQNLASIPFPSFSSIYLLYGFREQEEHCQRIFEKALSLLEKLGTKVIQFHSLDQLTSLFTKGHENRIIMIFSHYSSRSEFLMNKGAGIYFEQLLETIDLIRNQGKLRNDIVIDTTCCSTFHHFKTLYDHGVRLVYSSQNELRIALSAVMLYELCSCYNRKACNIQGSYIDGKTYLHEAWSKVLRCLYLSCLENGVAETGLDHKMGYLCDDQI